MTPGSLVNTAALLAGREASAREVLDAALAAIDLLDNRVLAWVTVDREGAARAATNADRRLRRGEPRSPLDGIPIGVKDLIDTAGLRTMYGSPLFEAHMPDADAHVVAALRRAGAVIVGKTVTTQFATFDPPPTRNPWNLAHTPGGSSSGSAAAVAANMVPGAVGTQTGGSTIRPASYCGVVGLMPSPGWVGRSGIYPCSWSLDRVGIFGSSVADVGMVLNGCIGVDAADPISRAPRRRRHRPQLPRRVGLLTTLLSSATGPMRAAVNTVAGRLVDSGVEVAELAVDDLEIAHAAHLMVMRAEIASVHAEKYRTHANAYAPQIAALIETGRRISAADFLRGLRFRSRFRRRFTQATDAFDLVLAPAAVGAAEADLSTIGSPHMNLLATFAGLPAIALPAAQDEAGLPLGVQLIGRQDDDDRLLSMAAALEEVLDFRRPKLLTP